MQVHIHTDTGGPVARKTQYLALRGGVVGVQPRAHQHLLAIERPSLAEDGVRMLSPDLVWEMVCDRNLQEMPGDAFVTEDWARVLDRGAYVEVPALRVVRRDEEEPTRVLVVDTRRVHEATGTRRFERFRKLSDLERAEIGRKSDQVSRLQELDHFLLT